MGYHHKLRATNFKHVGSPGATVGKSDLSSPAKCTFSQNEATVHTVLILKTENCVYITQSNSAYRDSVV